MQSRLTVLIFSAALLAAGGCGGPAIELPEAATGVSGLASSRVYGGEPWRTAPAVKWKFTAARAIWSTPAASGGIAYVGCDDGKLYAVSVEDGALKWTFETGGAVRSSPAIDGGKVFFNSYDGFLYAVDAASGALAWKYDLSEGYVPVARPEFSDFISSPVVAGPLVFCGSLNPRVRFVSVFAADGRLNWKFAAPRSFSVTATPAYAAGTVYFGGFTGRLYAVEAASGRMKWEFQAGDAVNSYPLTVSGGRLYGGSADGSLYCLEAGSGREVWKTNVATVAVKDFCGVTVSGGALYTANSNGSTLFALSPESGETIWKFNIGGSGWSSPAVRGGVVYAGSGGKRVYALDERTHEVLWKFETGGGVNAAPVFADGLLLIAAGDGAVYALRGK